MSATNPFIEKTKKWLEEAVIGLNLCPFAQTPYEKGQIEMVSCSLDGLELQIESSLGKLNEGEYETSLLVLETEVEFLDFYDICSSIEESLEQAQLDDIFQLVVFHPKFMFQGLASDSLAHTLNRSPYPTIHFLKKSSIEDLNLKPAQAEEISENNERRLIELEKKELERIFPWISKK